MKIQYPSGWNVTGFVMDYVVLQENVAEATARALIGSSRSTSPTLKELCVPWTLESDTLGYNVHAGAMVYRRSNRTNWIHYLATLDSETLELVKLLPLSDDQNVEGFRSALTNYATLEFVSASQVKTASFSKLLWNHKPATLSDEAYCQSVYRIHQFALQWYQRPSSELLPLCGSDKPIPVDQIDPRLVEHNVVVQQPLGAVTATYTFTHRNETIYITVEQATQSLVTCRLKRPTDTSTDSYQAYRYVYAYLSHVLCQANVMNTRDPSVVGQAMITACSDVEVLVTAMTHPHLVSSKVTRTADELWWETGFITVSCCMERFTERTGTALTEEEVDTLLDVLQSTLELDEMDEATLVKVGYLAELTQQYQSYALILRQLMKRQVRQPFTYEEWVTLFSM